jgi:ABC-type cobalamin/Fe3+-siderophores transport system ATPase subunit
MITLCREHIKFNLPDGVVQQNWSIPTKGLTCLSGANGIGKSSLIQGIKQNQKDLFNHPVSFLDQSPLTPMQDITLADALRFQAKVAIPSQEKQNIHLIQYLEKWVQEHQWPSLFRFQLNRMSGGENQMAKILLCLGLDAPLCIMDEPFNHLSQKNRDKALKLIQSFALEKAILLVNHRNEWLSTAINQQFHLIQKAPGQLEVQ